MLTQSAVDGDWDRTREGSQLPLQGRVVFAESIFAECVRYEHPECIGRRRQLTSDHLKRIRRRVQIRGREAIVVGLMGEQAVSGFVKRLGDVSLSLRDRNGDPREPLRPRLPYEAHRDLGSLRRMALLLPAPFLSRSITPFALFGRC